MSRTATTTSTQVKQADFQDNVEKRKYVEI